MTFFNSCDDDCLLRNNADTLPSDPLRQCERFGTCYCSGLKCNACQPGAYSTPGADCEWCPKGKYGPGTSPCEDCPAGRYSDLNSMVSSCKGCTAGRYGTGVGATSSSICTGVCPAGRWSTQSGLNNPDQCTLCESGRYSLPGATSSTLCTPCPTNTQNTPGNPCTACPEGKFSTPPASCAYPLCQSTNGEEANPACICGSATCTEETGFYCFASQNVCRPPPCIGDGEQRNSERCACGDTVCEQSYCDAGKSSCSAFPGLHTEGYTSISTGTCEEAGYAPLSLEECQGGAEALGWLDTDPDTSLGANMFADERWETQGDCYTKDYNNYGNCFVSSNQEFDTTTYQPSESCTATATVGGVLEIPLFRVGWSDSMTFRGDEHYYTFLTWVEGESVQAGEQFSWQSHTSVDTSNPGFVVCLGARLAEETPPGCADTSTMGGNLVYNTGGTTCDGGLCVCKLTAPPCAQGLNPPGCVCGDIVCTQDTGFYCWPSKSSCSKLPGEPRVEYPLVREGTCHSKGYAYINDVETLTTIALLIYGAYITTNTIRNSTQSNSQDQAKFA